MADSNCKRTTSAAAACAVSKRRKLQPWPPHKQQYYSQCSSPPSTMLLNSSDSCSSFCSDQSPPSSCCSSNDLTDDAAVCRRSSPLLDLEAKNFETVTSNSTSANNKFSRETTPSSELCLSSDEMKSPSPAMARGRRVPPVTKSPPSEEIEEFFAMAEKYEQKRFAEKYNYDIVKDSPLEGRYQWVRLKP